MSDVIAVRCHGCRVGMKIKTEYAGKLRKCPKCGIIFVVPSTDGDTTAPSEEVMAQLRRQMAQQAESKAKNRPEVKPEPTPQPEVKTEIKSETDEFTLQSDEAIRPVERPKRLDAQCRYFILDAERLVGYWQMTTGWQVNDGVKLVSARRNSQAIPKQGDFRFLELQLGEQDGEFRVLRIRIFQLARQYSVTKIALEENDVLTTITTQSGLTRSQKNVLLQSLKAHFMRGMWADSPAIYEYLLNDDYHSCDIL